MCKNHAEKHAHIIVGCVSFASRLGVVLGVALQCGGGDWAGLKCCRRGYKSEDLADCYSEVCSGLGAPSHRTAQSVCRILGSGGNTRTCCFQRRYCYAEDAEDHTFVQVGFSQL